MAWPRGKPRSCTGRRTNTPYAEQQQTHVLVGARQVVHFPGNPDVPAEIGYGQEMTAMSGTRIIVRVVTSMPSENARKEFADWADTHRILLESLPPGAITVTTIRGDDTATGRVVDKLRYELAVDDILGDLLVGDGTRHFEVLLPTDPDTLATWWSTHSTLASYLRSDDVSWRDERSQLPIKFRLDDVNVRLLRPHS